MLMQSPKMLGEILKTSEFKKEFVGQLSLQLVGRGKLPNYVVIYGTDYD